MYRVIGIVVMLTVMLSLSASAEQLVVVGKRGGIVSQLAKRDVIDIYMGRKRRLDNGVYVTPVDMDSDSGLRELFYQKLIRKTVAEINSYWAQLVFTGRAVPPRQADSVAEVIDRKSVV